MPSEPTAPTRHAVFYFDFRDPFSYLAAGPIQRLCRETGVSLSLEPVDSTALHAPGAAGVVGHDFWRQVNARARAQGLVLRAPQTFPFDATLLLKTCLFVRDRSGQEAMAAVADRLWSEVWQEGADPADPATAIRAGRGAAIPEPALLAGLSAPRVDEMLARVTRRAREAGIRATPALQVDSEIFSGFENLAAAEARLRGGGATGPAGDDPGGFSAPDWTFSG